MGRPLRISLPRPTRRASLRTLLILFLLSSILAWVLFYFIPASPWNRWYPPAWHPAVYNPPPSVNPRWWGLFANSRRWGTGPDPPNPSARLQPPASPFYTTTELDCASLPGTRDVLVVMKTRSTDTHSRLPVHLNSTFRCMPNFDIYSDLDEMIQGYTVHNAIDDIPSGRMISYPEFELYQEQLDAKRRGRKDVAGLSHAKHLHHAEEQALAAKLDRWKFLPMMEKALVTRKTAKWFVFLEDDTALIWSNLLLWLAKLPHNKPQYLGAQAYDGQLEYAHSGSGWILSNSAVRAVVEAARNDPAKYDAMVSDSSSGDRAVALALKESGISLTRSLPLVQPKPPSLLDYSAKSWCDPIVSFHRMTPPDVRDMWEFEQDWLAAAHARGPILRRDVFWAFVAPALAESRRHWNNLSDGRVLGRSDSDDQDEDDDYDYDNDDDDAAALRANEAEALDAEEAAAIRSVKGCRRLCEADSDCLQWRYRTGECALGYSIRLGAPQQWRMRGASGMTSGWIQARIEAFVERLEPCDEPTWNAAD